jgi:hypothetical protein
VFKTASAKLGPTHLAGLGRYARRGEETSVRITMTSSRGAAQKPT